MFFFFKDLFGNYIYDSVVNDTYEISETLFNMLSENKKI